MLNGKRINRVKVPDFRLTPEVQELAKELNWPLVVIPEFDRIIKKEDRLGERVVRFLLAESKAGRLASVVKDFLLLFTPYGSHINKATDFIAHIIEQKTKRNKPMNEKKPWYKSKTIIGAIVVIAVITLNFFGIEVTEAELQEVISTVIAAIASVVTIWGRVTASKKIDTGT